MKWSLLAVLAVALTSSLAFAPLSVPRTFVSQVISPISTTVRPRSHLGASPLHDISSIILSAADEAAVVAEEAAKGSGNGKLRRESCGKEEKCWMMKRPTLMSTTTHFFLLQIQDYSRLIMEMLVEFVVEFARLTITDEAYT